MMTNPIRNFTGLVVLLALATAASAQPALKLVTVDLVRAYESYWKTQEKEMQLADTAQKAQEDIERMKSEGKLIVDEARALQEKAGSDLLTAEAREQANAEFQQKALEVQKKEQQLQQFVANTDRQLQLRHKNHQELMLGEISDVVQAIGKARGATLILDTSGPTAVGISNVLWADEGYDITDQVIAKLNESKPADFELKPVPADASSSSTPSAPSVAPAIP